MPSQPPLPVTVVIPVRNEMGSIDTLLESVRAQEPPPQAVVVVDAGSTDGTREALRRWRSDWQALHVIEVPQAYPGVGRNLGTEAALTDWVVYIDGGTRPHEGWLTALWSAVQDGQVSAAYGFYAPAITTRMARWFAQATLLPARQTADGLMRNHFIACSIVRKQAWMEVGGFPPFRAAEDRIFMMAIDRLGFGESPAAVISWEGPQDWQTLWRRTATLAEHSARAGRARDWHWPTLRYWSVGLTLVIVTWPIGLLIWLGAWLLRSMRRLQRHRAEPDLRWDRWTDVLGVASILLVMDLALFIGWSRSLKPDLATRPGHP